MPAKRPTIRDIDPRGPAVRLSDGSNWQIRPGSDALGLRYWSVGDPIRVEETGTGRFAYRLTNPRTPGPEKPLAARPRPSPERSSPR